SCGCWMRERSRRSTCPVASTEWFAWRTSWSSKPSGKGVGKGDGRSSTQSNPPISRTEDRSRNGACFRRYQRTLPLLDHGSSSGLERGHGPRGPLDGKTPRGMAESHRSRHRKLLEGLVNVRKPCYLGC